MNKTILDIKREVDTIKKTQSEAALEIETLGKKSGTIDASIITIIERICQCSLCVYFVGYFEEYFY